MSRAKKFLIETIPFTVNLILYICIFVEDDLRYTIGYILLGLFVNWIFSKSMVKY